MRSALGLLLCIAANAGPAAASQQCQLRGKPWLEGRVVDTVATSAAVDAHGGERIEVFVVAHARVGKREAILSDDGRRGHTAWAAAGCAATVNWSRIEPRAQHTDTPSPNDGVAVYANARLFGATHGAWIGYDRLEYVTTPLDGAHGTRLIVDSARPTDTTWLAGRPAAHRELGAMHLVATVDTTVEKASTPALDGEGQLDGRAFRYSLRAGDDFLGWLTAFYNVPYVFGSAGTGARSQAERFVGTDCADLLVAALRRAGHAHLEYSSVSGLLDTFVRTSAPSTITDGKAPDPPLVFGTDVAPGDLLALDYIGVDELPRPWDHIVALVEDRGPDGRPDGVLGPEDIVADAGDSRGLHFAPLSEQGNVRVAVMRVPPRKYASR